MKGIGLAVRLIILAACLAIVQEPRLLAAVNGVGRGDSAMEARKVAEAITEYRTALEALPADAQVLERLVSATLFVRRPDMALLYLRQLVAAHGWTLQRYQDMAEALAQNGDRLQATVYLRASLTGTLADVPALRQLAVLAADAQDWKNANELLTRLIALAPDDEQTLYHLGLLTIPADPQTGLAYLDRAAADPEYRPVVDAIRSAVSGHSQEPEQALAFQIGLAMSNLKLWSYAEHALNIALDGGESRPAAYALLGLVQDQQGRDGWALIQQGLAAAPNDSMVNYAAAVHWRLAGDTPRALAALARAESLDPQNPAIAAEIAGAYESIGRLDYAALWLNMAVSLAPNNAGFRGLLADFYARSGYNLKGEGLDAIRKIADQLPKDAEVRASLGWALMASGQLDAAQKELDQALVLDPTNVRAHYYYAVLLQNRGDSDGAIKNYLYVYRDTSDNAFRDLAAGALKRLGYNVDPNQAGS